MSWYEKIVPSKYSPSRSVSSYFDSGWDDYVPVKRETSEGKNYEFRLQMGRILGELNRSANMIAGKNGDNHFTVKFAGSNSNFGEKGMEIDPSIIVESRDKIVTGDSYYEAMDALNGRVIIGAHIRNNADTGELKKLWNHTDIAAKKLFGVVLEQQSYEEVSAQWAGFVPYLEKHRQCCHMSGEQVLKQAPNAAMQSQEDRFLNVIQYNILNPDNMINLEGELGDIVRDTMWRVSNTMDSCVDAMNYLRSRLHNDKKKKEETEQSGDSPVGSPKPSPVSGVGDFQLISTNVSTSEELKDLSSIIPADSTSLCEVKWVVEEETVSTLNVKSYKTHYQQFVLHNRKSIMQISSSLQFAEVVQDLHSRGLSSGELDENAFWKLRHDRRHIFEKKDAAKRADVVVGLLLDQSGSMRGNKIGEAKQATIIIYEALKSLEGVHPVVMGHTGQESYHEQVTMIPYVVPEKNNCHALWGAKARLQNIDGEAIKHIGKRMQKVASAGKRFLLVISDGQPAAIGYYGEPAILHTADCIKKLRKSGVQVFGVGISNAFSDSIGKQLYGNNNYVVLSDTLSSIKIMSVKLKQFFSKY